MFDNPIIQNPPKRTTDFRVKYKTEKCKYLVEKGYCPFRQNCTFAHSEVEIRDKLHISNKYKTKPCINFAIRGYCTYGKRCHYLHEEGEDSGEKTRSNSEESDCSRSSQSSRCCWTRLSHSKRIELIQTLGLDYSIRTSSRLLQLLNSNENEQNWKEWMFEEIASPAPSAGKKYSM